MANLLARLGSVIQRAGGPVGLVGDLPPDSVGARLLAGVFPGQISMPPARGTRDYLLAYSTMPWLRAVVSKIAWSVASVEWQLYAGKSPRTGKYTKDARLTALARAGTPTRRHQQIRQMVHEGEAEAITSHPMLDLLNAANPYHTGLQNRQLLQTHLELVGEGFWLKERNGAGMPTAVWPLPPNWVTSTPTIQNPQFRISWRGWQGWIPETEILWMASLDPENPYARGTGHARSLGDELETDEFASKHLRQFFFNHARPDLIVSADGLSPDETRRMEMDWMNRHQGFWRAFKPYFIGRKLTVTELGQGDFRSQQMVQLRQHERDMILQGWGVPPEVMGVIENSNRATIDAATYIFALHVVVPRLEFQRAIYQERLVPEFDERLVIDYVSPVNEDRLFELEQMKAAPWALLVNEWRERMGLEPRDDGDVYMVPTLMAPAETLEPEAEPEVPEETLTAPMMPPGAMEPEAQMPAAASRRTVLRARAQTTATRIDTVARAYTPRLREAYREAVRTAKANLNLGLLDYQLDRRDLVGAQDSLAHYVLGDTFGRSARSTMGEAYRASGEAASRALRAAANGRKAPATQGQAALRFDATNPRAIAWAEHASATLVKRITHEQREAIRVLLRDALTGESTVALTARELRDIIGLLPAQARAVDRFRDRLEERGVEPEKVEARTAKYAEAQVKVRAETIARTEIQRAAYEGQQELWRQGVERGELDPARTLRVWMVTDDDRLDETVCEPMDEQAVGLDEPFITGDGDEVMTPPAHPRCRCAVVLDFDRETVAPSGEEEED